MYDIKQKPKMDKPKLLEKSTLLPRDISGQMRRKYQEELSRKEPEDRQVSNTYAVDRLEKAGTAVAVATGTAGKRASGYARAKMKKKRQRVKDRQLAEEQTFADTPEQAQGGTAYQSRGKQYAAQQSRLKTRETLEADRTSSVAFERHGLPYRSPAQRQAAAKGKALPDGKRKAETTRQMKQAQTKAAHHARTRLAVKKQMGKKLSPAQQAKQKAKQEAQRQMARQAAHTAKAAAKTTAKAIAAVGKVIAAAAKAFTAALVAAGPIAILLVVLILFAVVAAVVASPFGIFFSAEDAATNVVPVSQVVAECNADLAAQIDGICQSNPHDKMTLTGQAADWADILAVFAVKTAGGKDGTSMDVVTIDAARVSIIKAVFSDMSIVAYTTETITHGDSSPEDDVDDSYTETILHITITAKTADEMAGAYDFTSAQLEMLAAMLAERALLSGLAGDISVSSADAAEILRALPADLPEERKAVIQTAMQLVGKVGYFWGGKSSAIGWDSRWGTPAKVTAAGSSATGTVRAYGLDCSGYVDWVFHNAHNYVIGHGGGAASQHAYCTDIAWNEAQIGDLVFYPGDSHVGIVCGFDEDGNIRIVHCASGYNNVVITGKEGFVSVGRPDYYTET